MAEKDNQTEKTGTQLPIERYRQLQKQKEEILLLDPREALERILDAPQPAALVHSFPEEDLYFLVHDIGTEDALQLLSLASDKQLEFILDVEVWQKDRIELSAVTRWFDLLLRADPKRFVERFVDREIEFVEYYLYRNIEVVVREHDQDPSDFGKEYFTFDDMFYVRFLDSAPETGTEKPEPEKTDAKRREAFLSDFLKRLAAYDHKKFQHLLLEAARVLPAESEEEAFRLRNVRLAEKGFFPFDQALGIYQYLSPKHFEVKEPKMPLKATEEPLPIPFVHGQLLEENDPFTRALKSIETQDLLRQLQAEFAGLCNQILAADQKIIRDRNQLRVAVKKACGYLGIGLERLTGKPNRLSESESAALLARHPLADIFRMGFGLALELKWRAEKWRKASWFENNGMPLSFWGEAWLGVLGGLLIKKPLFFDNYKSGVLYRDFFSLEEIKTTEKVLDRVFAFDRLFLRMNLKVKPELVTATVNYKNLLLTLWSRSCLGLSEELQPVRMKDFKPFYDGLWEPSAPRRITLSTKESFVRWVSVKTGSAIEFLSESMGSTFEELFNEVENEYAKVLSKDLDPRYVTFFILSQ